MLATIMPAVKLQTDSTPDKPAVPRPLVGPSRSSGPLSNASAVPPTSDSRSIRSKRSSSATSWRWDSTCSGRSWHSPATATPGRT